MENKLPTITIAGVLIVITGVALFQISKQPVDFVPDNGRESLGTDVPSGWIQHEDNVFGFSLAYPGTLYFSK